MLTSSRIQVQQFLWLQVITSYCTILTSGLITGFVISMKKVAKIKKRAGVVRTRLTKIEKDLLVKLDTTGVAGGQLTSKAIEFYRHWLLAHTDKNRRTKSDWLVIQATGTKVKN